MPPDPEPKAPVPAPAAKPARTRLEVSKDYAATIQSILTIIAILVGAYWYFLERGHVVKANVTHRVERVEIGNGFAWVQLTAEIENKSKHQITIRGSKAWLQQIYPLTADMNAVVQQIKADKLSPRILIKDSGRVEWPALGVVEGKQVRVVVEPGETERVVFEFVVPAESQVLRAYTFLQPDLEKSTGWANISVHRIVSTTSTAATAR
jgi:hypothetical protein